MALRARVLVRGKAGRVDEVEVDPRTAQCLLRHTGKSKAGGPLFTSESRPDRALDVRSLRKIIKRLFATADVRGHLSCHSLRHSLATILAESGVPVTEVSRKMRHSHVMTTVTRYFSNDPTHYSDKSRAGTRLIKLDMD